MCSESHRACFCNWCKACLHSADTRRRLHKIYHQLRAGTPHNTSNSSCHLYCSTCDHKARYFRTRSRLRNLFPSNFRDMTRQRCSWSYRCNSVHQTRSGTHFYKHNYDCLACWHILGNTHHYRANIRLHQYSFCHQLKVRNQGNTSSCNYLHNCCTLAGSHVDRVDTRLCPHKKFRLVEAESHLNKNSWTFQACSRKDVGNPIGQFGIHLCPRTSCHHLSAENRVHTSIWNFLERLNKRTRNLRYLTSIRWHLDSVSRRLRECNPKSNHNGSYPACLHTHVDKGSETDTHRCRRKWVRALTNLGYTCSNSYPHCSHKRGRIHHCWWCIRRGRCMTSCRFSVYARSNKNTGNHHPCWYTCVDSHANLAYIHRCRRKIDCCGWTSNRRRRYIGDTDNYSLCRCKINCRYR